MKLGILFLCLLPLAFCWWETGHMLGAQIAYDTLLKTNPEALQLAKATANALNPLSDKKSQNFVEDAPWADDIKGKGFLFLNSWHFVDRQVNPNGYNKIKSKQNDYDGSRAMNDIRNCLKDYMSRGAKNPNMQVSMFTRLAIHIILDLHQPLHCATLIDDKHKPNDMGGNKFMVKFNGKTVNLHAFWDSGAYEWPEFQRPLDTKDWKSLKALANRIREAHPIESFKKNLENRKVDDWVTENYEVAKTKVYKPIMEYEGKELPDAYKQESLAIMERQVALGGYRLAQFIESVFRKETTILRVPNETYRE